MSPLQISLLTGVIALLAGLATVPIFGMAAKNWNIVDRPDSNIKLHHTATPYLGGLAIYLATLVAVSFTLDFDQRLLGLLLGGTVIVLLGFIDDFKALTPAQKLLGQVLAVTIGIKSGIYIQKEAIPLFLHIPVTYLWILGVINAINFIDGIDGQAASICFVIFCAFILWGNINGDYALMGFSAAMAGSLLAFLVFNAYPASIFMGDTGSMFLGLIIGTVSIDIDYAGPSRLTIFIPLITLGLPLFNMVYVMMIRGFMGMSPFRGTLDHWHDNLKSMGLSTNAVVLVSTLVTAVLSALGFVVLFLNYKMALLLQLTLLLLALLTMALFYFRKRRASPST
ncbi:undecaprenyl/decaprenyl-phosphate alpha-N-acetylglucosaminyl 1-phosphate transferase [Myxococcota bacterium]|nr:undecaprenyl/decaprenyl-phosphate alpha-N-acetylglucosaminyl 1-phosphate transferase [Myxococcota bacterium]